LNDSENDNNNFNNEFNDLIHGYGSDFLINENKISLKKSALFPAFFISKKSVSQ
jgi:hypothetical protein